MNRTRSARDAALVVAAVATLLVAALLAAGPVRGAPRLEPPLQLTTRPETLPPPPRLTPRPETQPPPPSFPTRGPTALPQPTMALPTQAPSRPDDRDDNRDDRDDRQEQPQAPAVEQSTGEASPTRTRRPTRTPRTTATPTPTPIAAGSLRLTLVSYPGAPAMGETVEFHVSVANRTDGAAHDLTLQSRVPSALIVETIEADEGQTARADGVVRWYIPNLAAGDSATLRMRGVLSRAPESGLDLCATLISSGAPLEQCARIEVGSGAEADDLPGADDATEPPPQATVQPTSANLPFEVSPTLFGWSVLIAGLAVLGLWLGLVLRGRRE